MRFQQFLNSQMGKKIVRIEFLPRETKSFATSQSSKAIFYQIVDLFFDINHAYPFQNYLSMSSPAVD
jgi:hypothetical protein